MLPEKELLRLREEARMLEQNTAADVPFAAVVERFLEAYEGRPVYPDFSDELHWFMGAESASGSAEGCVNGNGRQPGGRFRHPVQVVADPADQRGAGRALPPPGEGSVRSAVGWWPARFDGWCSIRFTT